MQQGEDKLKKKNESQGKTKFQEGKIDHQIADSSAGLTTRGGSKGEKDSKKRNPIAAKQEIKEKKTRFLSVGVHEQAT